MAERPKFATRAEYEAWRTGRRSGGATATLEPPEEATSSPQPGATRTRPMPRRVTSTPVEKDGGWASMVPFIGGAILVVALVFAGLRWSAYNDTSIHPGSSIDSPARLRPQIAKYINRSKAWDEYFRVRHPTSPVAKFALTLNRHETKSYGGDYNAGSVTVRFEVTNLTNGQPLYEHSGTLKLDSFIIVSGDATREDIQDAAFRGTEEKFFPYLDRWVDLAAIEAMKQEGSGGKAFVPFFTVLSEDSAELELIEKAPLAIGLA